MDEKKYGNSFDENNAAGRSDNERRTADFSESAGGRDDSSSYYYSYGPFQSVNSEGENGGRPQQVEVTPPSQVRSYNSFNSPNPQSGDAPNGKSGGNWNYNQKPKSSLRNAVTSFAAGALGAVVITGSVFTAGHAGWFSSSDSTSAAAATQTASTANASANSTGTAQTAAYTLASSKDISEVVSQAGPSVVKIETLSKGGSSGNRSSSSYSDPFFQYFYGGSQGDGGSGSRGNSGSGSSSDQLTPLGLGTGFIFDKEGYILTNNHVVEGGDVIQVTVDGTTKPYEAKLLGSSADLDLAVLKITSTDGKDFPAISLGNSDNTAIGNWVVAIGNPEGFEHTVTAGVLSAKEREISIADETTGQNVDYKHLLQTDASINPGNSGGPLLNLQGEVIGMNTAVSTDAQGIGFAISSNTIKEVVDKLKNNEEIPKEAVPFIGASLTTMSDSIAQQMGVDTKEGSLVSEVLYGSPAYKADLRSYDIIGGVNGTPYATSSELIEAIQTFKVGDTITLNVIRNNQKVDLKVTIADRNEYEKSAAAQQNNSENSQNNN
ncbi:trypsin-like peptidase domain-containing protein [Saccharibacillus sp. CPCC 101409]|uniref:S1C family serine protease n=1 Tax=Saccharibacillus sp. CPCC 101409 TaxID=3058041 RepID=UPI002673FB4C|nr:trypsin-like peptidase domain-containing protein [Saccharibacillus sp. CPCC 101409]MDO3408797.1 trypsin-like peptidase domain-containing protein [Saccharibacillus sp. CPCC 101409]